MENKLAYTLYSSKVNSFYAIWKPVWNFLLACPKYGQLFIEFPNSFHSTPNLKMFLHQIAEILHA